MKPNHICKNPDCRKQYFACNYCDATRAWHSACCSEDCYIKYVDYIKRNNKIIGLPERIDMSEDDVIKLMNMPIDKVKEDTINSLMESEYKEYFESHTLEETIDKINKDNENLN